MKVIHIGFPKTATTFLQKNIFTQLPHDFKYFNKEASSKFFKPIMDYDDSVLEFRIIKNSIEKAWQGQKNVLFSYEPLTGLHYQSAFVNRTLIANRLRDLGFKRVIMTIRNQFDALESTYKQYIKSGGVMKFDDYISFDEHKAKYLYPEYFDYYPIYKLYGNL